MKARILITLLICQLLIPLMSAADYPFAIPKLEAVVGEEMDEWGIGGVAVALVDDQDTVYVKGFGEAGDDSMFRVGSISKLLNPLGMQRSAWLRGSLPDGGLVKAHMRVTDGNGGWWCREAPVFELETIPAGNLYASAGDIARFASALLAEGKGLISPGSLIEMWKPQFTDESSVFELGFVVGKFREHRSIGHGGAVFGFSTSIVVLPEAKVAAIVLANEDIVSSEVVWHASGMRPCALLSSVLFQGARPWPLAADVSTRT